MKQHELVTRRKNDLINPVCMILWMLFKNCDMKFMNMINIENITFIMIFLDILPRSSLFCLY